MNCARKYSYFGIFLSWMYVNATITLNDFNEFTYAQPTVVREAKVGDNITLVCHPELQNTNKTLDKLDFEWISDFGIPIYTKGRLSPHLSFSKLDSEVQYRMENSSLIVYNLVAGPIRFTCRIPRLKSNYSYLFHVNRRPEMTYKYVRDRKLIIDAKEGETLTLPCVMNSERFTSISDVTYAWVLINLQKSIIEIISFGRQIILENNIDGYEINNNASLIIPEFCPSDRVQYECRLSNGEFVNYALPQKQKAQAMYTYQSENTEKNVTIERGNTVILKCPKSLFINQSEFIWTRNGKRLLFINNNVIKNRKSNHFQIASDQRSLLIANFTPYWGGIYKCSSQKRSSYVYNVTEQKNTVTKIKFVVPRQTVDLFCPTSNAENGSYFVWVRNDTEFLFINNRRIADSNTSRLRFQGDGRSLVITRMTATMQGKYECRLSSGLRYTYSVTMLFADNPFVRKEKLVAKFGTRRILLPCPGVGNRDDDWYEWIFNGKHQLATLLYLKGKKFATHYSKYYNLDGTSLIILLLDAPQVGVYTCRWSNNVQYVYDISYRINWYNFTLTAPREANISFGFSITEKDRDSELMSWAVPLKSGSYERFNFAAGKLTPNGTNSLPIKPDNIEFSHNNQLITIYQVGDESERDYFFNLVASSTVYKFSFKLVDQKLT